METINTKSILALFDNDPEQNKTFVADVLLRLKTGEIQVSDIANQINNIEEILKEIKSDPLLFEFNSVRLSPAVYYYGT